MKMVKVFDCDVPLVYESLEGTGTIGHYEPDTDRIVLCTTLEKDFPYQRHIVYLHEMFHATGGECRSFRFARLKKAFGKKGFRVEECIAEICTLVAMRKLNILTPSSRTIPEKGILDHYDKDIFIPWREVTAAMDKFKVEGVDFSQDLLETRKYLAATFKMNIKDGYERFDH